jgi:hypothetical protein
MSEFRCGRFVSPKSLYGFISNLKNVSGIFFAVEAVAGVPESRHGCPESRYGFMAKNNPPWFSGAPFFRHGILEYCDGI